MTIGEIAEIAGVNPETVRRAIKQEWPDKIHNGKVTHLGWHEAVIVMAAIRKKGFITPTQNVKLPTQNVKVAKLPCGAQLRELRMIYGPGEAQKRIDFAIGYHQQVPEQRQIQDMTPHGLSKQAYAVQKRVEEQIKKKEEDDRLNGHLF